MKAATEKANVKLGKERPILISDHLNDDEYIQIREGAVKEYQTNPEFQEVCQTMSTKSTESRLRAKGSSFPPDIDKAVTYVLDKLPAYTHSAQVFEYPSATLSYPTSWPVGEFLESHPTTLTPDPNSHFIVLDFPLESAHA